MSRNHAADHLLSECAKWRGGVPGLAIVTAPGFDPGELFAAQLGTFAAVGLLDPDEASDWWRRFHDGAPPPPLDPDPALRERAQRHLESLRDDPESLSAALGTLMAIGVLGPAEATAALGPNGEDPDDDQDDWPDIGEGDLRRVVLGPAEEAGGVRVIAVELYAGGLLVRWTGHRLPELAVSDDLGTAYAEVDAEGDESGGGRMRGVATFAPAVPGHAGRLAIDVDGGRLEVAL